MKSKQPQPKRTKKKATSKKSLQVGKKRVVKAWALALERKGKMYLDIGEIYARKTSAMISEGYLRHHGYRAIKVEITYDPLPQGKRT